MTFLSIFISVEFKEGKVAGNVNAKAVLLVIDNRENSFNFRISWVLKASQSGHTSNHPSFNEFARESWP